MIFSLFWFSINPDEFNSKVIKEEAIIESLISFKRAGANAIVTYFADDIADKLR